MYVYNFVNKNERKIKEITFAFCSIILKSFQLLYTHKYVYLYSVVKMKIAIMVHKNYHCLCHTLLNFVVFKT